MLLDMYVQAFQPVRTGAAGGVARLRQFGVRERCILPKLDISGWQLLGSIEDEAFERPRICPDCIKAGLHSYGFQGELIARCPLHRRELSTSCPACGWPLVWGDPAYPSRSALYCPRGCSLYGSLFGGLFEPPACYAKSLSDHWQWVRSAKKVIHFLTSPLVVTYPPCAHAVGGGLISGSTPGLVPAICSALRSCGVAVPEALPFHAVDHGRWTVVASKWLSRASANGAVADQMESLTLRFQRGPYTTQVPLTDPLRIKKILRSIKSRSSVDRLDISHESGVALLNVSSSMFTNAEISALCRCLGTSDDATSNGDYYMDVLVDWLTAASERCAALKVFPAASPILRVTDRFDALVCTRPGMIRLSGYAVGDSESQTSWDGYCERAELGGAVYVASGHGPPF